MNALAFRRATEEDIDFLVSVLHLADRDRHAQKEGWDDEQYIDRCRAETTEEVAGRVEKSLTCVVEAAGTPVGRLRVIDDGEELFIAGIQILPAHQGKGVGTAAVRSVMDDARAKGVSVRLEVEKSNPDAKRLYLRLGFEVIEDRGDKELMEIHPVER